MLAQSFKSATDLQISDVELSSLITVLGMLERCELVHEEYMYNDTPRGNKFNMGIALTEASCGTLGCIAGWAYAVSNRKAFPEIVSDNGWDRHNKGLIKLFGIGENTYNLSTYTTDQAAIALRSYLTTGEAKWE
jgi:hypothetical protein